ncbi:MAG: helix-turn-helix domain-containing protein [Betaproteobacteria bacterium]|nr:helix-turn-helix domain-containing protein [Betaproteobacteria bacterium]
MGTTTQSDDTSARGAFLVALGERLRRLRLRRGMTRKAAAAASGISERHLANLELGTGNASILVLQQLADALACPLAEVVGDVTTRSPEWLLLRDMLSERSEAELEQARACLSELFGAPGRAADRTAHVALVGLRGAGKSTLGQRLARHAGTPFVELSREIERVAGCSLDAIHSLYGADGYRRYERIALEGALAAGGRCVLATPGGLVSEPRSFELLLARCFTVWLRASPEEHMRRVVAQGDFRPMSGNAEAMADLRRILDGRSPFYAKADVTVDTGGQSEDSAFEALCATLASAVDWIAPAR